MYVVGLDLDKNMATSWYIPPHMVQHNGKNRVIFNCSFQFQGQNPNILVLPRPSLGRSLQAVVLCFPEHFVTSSAASTACSTRSGQPPPQGSARNPLSPTDMYVWRVLSFSMTSIPCCAVSHCKIILEHSREGPVITQILSLSEKVKTLVDNVQALLAKGGFELHQWASNQ